MPLFDVIGLGGEKIAVIIDIGEAYTKCGFASEVSPRHIIPSSVSRNINGKIFEEQISPSTVTNTTDSSLYGALRDFIHNIYFRYLLVNPKERRVVLCESVLWPTKFRETLAKVLFYHFEVPSVLFAPSHLMSLFTLGISTGLVMECGYSETSVLPIYEGIPMINSIEFLPLGGKIIHERLKSQLMEKGLVHIGTGIKPLSSIQGENSVVIISGANLLLTEDDVKAAKDIMTSASVLICQLEIKPEVTQTALSIAKKAGVTTIFNPAPAQSWLDTMFYKDSDVFCANETEAEILTGVPISSIEDAFNALPVLLGRGASKIVITLGENGSVVATREDPTPRHVPSKEGAGDAFVGALAFYLSKYKGLTFVEMVRRANEIAAISVCGPGTQTSYPTVAKLPPALFDPPGVNSYPQRSPKPDTTIVHPRSKSKERRSISLPNDNVTSRDGKHRNSNESPPKGQRRASNDDAPSNTKKTRGFFARRRSEGSVGSRKQMVEQSKSNGKVTKGDNEGNSETKRDMDMNGRRGSVPQIQGVALAEVETVGRETMIDF